MADVGTLATGIPASGLIAIGAGIVMGLGCLATAWSQASIGAASMGLIAERPEFGGNVLIWIALPETMAVLSFVIAIMMVLNMGGAH
ncbi:MAG: hypothetical protein QXL47_02545 [Candidatus Anstonellales archaeon]